MPTRRRPATRRDRHRDRDLGRDAGRATARPWRDSRPGPRRSGDRGHRQPSTAPLQQLRLLAPVHRVEQALAGLLRLDLDARAQQVADPRDAPDSACWRRADQAQVCMAGPRRRSRNSPRVLQPGVPLLAQFRDAAQDQLEVGRTRREPGGCARTGSRRGRRAASAGAAAPAPRRARRCGSRQPRRRARARRQRSVAATSRADRQAQQRHHAVGLDPSRRCTVRRAGAGSSRRRTTIRAKPSASRRKSVDLRLPSVMLAPTRLFSSSSARLRLDRRRRRAGHEHVQADQPLARHRGQPVRWDGAQRSFVERRGRGGQRAPEGVVWNSVLLLPAHLHRRCPGSGGWRPRRAAAVARPQQRRQVLAQAQPSGCSSARCEQQRGGEPLVGPRVDLVVQRDPLRLRRQRHGWPCGIEAGLRFSLLDEHRPRACSDRRQHDDDDHQRGPRSSRPADSGRVRKGAPVAAAELARGADFPPSSAPV